ncbi:hypothetical protein GDO86_009708, partial [Hymenochirus boettgeri]
NCGTYFPSVKKDPSKYLKPCPDAVKHWLRGLKSSRKIMLLITSSHSDYCRLLCEYILGKNFEDLFDIIITNALKPGFFSLYPQQRAFWTLENDEEIHVLASLEKPGWYSQGNWVHLNDLLKNMTGKSEPKIAYFGDSIRSDIFTAHHYSNWETVLILEELEGEEVFKPNMTDLGSSLKKKGKYDGQCLASRQWGSYFVDSFPCTQKTSLTWCCASIRNYSTIVIPSITSVVDLPLDYKFPRFSMDHSETAGFYPCPPKVMVHQIKQETAV